MKLDLPVLPLDTVDSVGYQKCLLPKIKFPPHIHPGHWAKCLWSLNESQETFYIVAQVFPRAELENHCYLDTSVTNYHLQKDQQLQLTNLVLLEKCIEINEVDLLFHLNTQYFIENSGNVTKTYLLEMAKLMLQKYRLTNNCLVTDPVFLENGIDSIGIEFENDKDSNISYLLTDDTKVNIKNISLAYQTLNHDLIALNIEPFAQARQELNVLINLLQSQRHQKRSLCLSLNALLVGPVGCGKTTIVEEFLQQNKCNVFRIEITNCLKQYPGETEAELRKIFKAANDFENKFKSKDPTVLLLEEIHLLCPQTSSTANNNSEALVNSMRITTQLLTLIDELFTNRINIMCLATTSKLDNLNELIRRPGRFENEVSIAGLQEEQRLEILKLILKKTLPNLNIAPSLYTTMAKQTQGYVIADLALLVRNISQIVLTQPQENLETIISEIVKKSKPISLKGTDVTAFRTTETFASIGGMFKLKNILQVSVLAGLKQKESFERFGLSLPKGVLLYGPPGCAKTTVAKCLATEANMTFIATSGAEVYSPYVGCAEKFIAKIFQTARKNSPCLIFLDEIDSLVGRRSIMGSSNSGDVQVRILSTILTEMDGVIASSGQNAHILVVAATNRPDMVDDALMRPGRFDKLIHVPAPDLLSRRSIFDLYKTKMPFFELVDLDFLALRTDNYSGADICNLCNEAAMQAFQRDFNTHEIIMEDFENVLKTSKSSLRQSQIDWYYQFENKF